MTHVSKMLDMVEELRSLGGGEDIASNMSADVSVLVWRGDDSREGPFSEQQQHQQQQQQQQHQQQQLQQHAQAICVSPSAHPGRIQLFASSSSATNRRFPGESFDDEEDDNGEDRHHHKEEEDEDEEDGETVEDSPVASIDGRHASRRHNSSDRSGATSAAPFATFQVHKTFDSAEAGATVGSHPKYLDRVFEQIVRPMADRATDRSISGNLFLMGQRGTGKSYTLFAPTTGILDRLAMYLIARRVPFAVSAFELPADASTAMSSFPVRDLLKSHCSSNLPAAAAAAAAAPPAGNASLGMLEATIHGMTAVPIQSSMEDFDLLVRFLLCHRTGMDPPEKHLRKGLLPRRSFLSNITPRQQGHIIVRFLFFSSRPSKSRSNRPHVTAVMHLVDLCGNARQSSVLRLERAEMQRQHAVNSQLLSVHRSLVDICAHKSLISSRRDSKLSSLLCDLITELGAQNSFLFTIAERYHDTSHPVADETDSLQEALGTLRLAQRCARHLKCVVMARGAGGSGSSSGGARRFGDGAHWLSSVETLMEAFEQWRRAFLHGPGQVHVGPGSAAAAASVDIAAVASHPPAQGNLGNGGGNNSLEDSRADPHSVDGHGQRLRRSPRENSVRRHGASSPGLSDASRSTTASMRTTSATPTATTAATESEFWETLRQIEQQQYESLLLQGIRQQQPQPQPQPRMVEDGRGGRSGREHGHGGSDSSGGTSGYALDSRKEFDQLANELLHGASESRSTAVNAGSNNNNNNSAGPASALSALDLDIGAREVIHRNRVGADHQLASASVLSIQESGGAALSPSAVMDLEAARYEVDRVQGNYHAVADLLVREKATTADLREQLHVLESSRDERRMELEVALESERLENISLRSKLRILQGESGDFSPIFDIYETEIRSLQQQQQQQQQLQQRQEQHQQEHPAAGSAKNGTTRLNRLVEENRLLREENSDLKKKERQLMLSKKFLEGSALRINHLSNELGKVSSVATSKAITLVEADAQIVQLKREIIERDAMLADAMRQISQAEQAMDEMRQYVRLVQVGRKKEEILVHLHANPHRSVAARIENLHKQLQDGFERCYRSSAVKTDVSLARALEAYAKIVEEVEHLMVDFAARERDAVEVVMQLRNVDPLKGVSAPRSVSGGVGAFTGTSTMSTFASTSTSTYASASAVAARKKKTSPTTDSASIAAGGGNSGRTSPVRGFK